MKLNGFKALVALQSQSLRNVPRILKYRDKHYDPADHEGIDQSIVPESVIRAYQQPHKYLSDDEIIQIVEKYRTGSSTYELANEYGCHRRTICNALKNAGVTVSNKASTRDPLLIENVIKMYDDFMRPVDIGSKLGISESTVRRILHENGVTLRHSSEYRKGIRFLEADDCI